MAPTDTDLLRAFLPCWPAGSHLTTRAVQVMAGLRSLDGALQATDALCAEGLLEMEQIGATRLWYPRAAATAVYEPAPASGGMIAERGLMPVLVG